MAITYREDLKADAVYYINEDAQYFYTPDGEGGIFYDTEEELIEAHGNGYRSIEIDELSDY